MHDRDRGAEPWPTPRTAAPRRVLVVEDDADAGEMLQALLRAHGHEARLARSGDEALAACARGPVDVVLCDLVLPGMSGYEVVRAMRGAPASARIPVVALTGRGRPQDRERTRAAGFREHLVKPVTVEALEELLGRL